MNWLVDAAAAGGGGISKDFSNPGVLKKVNNWTTTQNARCTIGEYIPAPTESRSYIAISF